MNPKTALSRRIGLCILVAGAAVLLLPTSVIADKPDPSRPLAPRPSVTTTTTSAVQAASVGPDGLRAVVDLKTRKTTSDSALDLRRTIPRPGVDLLVSLASRACNANRDTWVWETVANTPNGFWCAAHSSSNGGGGISLEGEARARIRTVPWPDLVIESNPVKAIVAVPTYYWIRSYNGAPRRVNPSVTIQAGETCHDVTDEDGNPIGQSCTPNLVTYAMSITATPTNYLWSWDDVRQDPHYWRQLGTHDLPLPSPIGLGIPYVPPFYQESPVVHVFEDSSYYHEPAGYTVTLTITYALTWEATAPGGRRQGGALGDWRQTATIHQHVHEIQIVHCLPEIKNSCP